MLAERVRDGAWDLSGVVVVTPGSRAGRVLISMLADKASGLSVPLDPPLTITPSELPGSVLVSMEARHGAVGAGWRARPPASSLVREAMWIRALRSQSRETIAALSAMEVAPDDIKAWNSLARVVARSAGDLAAAGLRLRDAAARANEIAEFSGTARLEAAASIQDAYELLLDQYELCDSRIAAIDAMTEWTARLMEVENSTENHVAEVVLVGVVEMSRVMRRSCTLPGVRTLAIIAGPDAWADRYDELGCLIAGTHDNGHAGESASLAASGGVPWLQAEDVWIGEDPRDQAVKALAAIAGLSDIQPVAPHEVLLGVPDASVGFHLEREARRVGARVRAGLAWTVSHCETFRICEALVAHSYERTLTTMRGAMLRPRIEAWIHARLRDHADAGTPGPRAMLRRGVLDAIDSYAAYAVHSSLEVGFITRRPEIHWMLDSARDSLDVLCRPIAAARTGADAAMALLKALAVIFRDGALDTAASPGQRREAAAAKAIAQGLREAGTDLGDALGTLGAGPSSSPIAALELALDSIGTTPIADDPEPESIEGLGWLEILLDPAPNVVLTGMNAGLVPSRNTPDPLVPEALRRAFGMEHAGSRAARDAALFAAMLACKARVIAVLGRRDEEGSALMPSPVILPDSGVALADLLDRFTRESGPDLSSQRFRATRSASARPARSRSRACVPWLDAPIPMSLSVTSLREYLRSPYVFYLRHVLGADELDAPVSSVDAALMGTLLHRTLEALHTRCPNATDAAAIERVLVAALDEQIATTVAISHERDGVVPLLLGLQVESVRARLRAAAVVHAATRREGWRTVASEASLAGGLVVASSASAPPFPILRGKIDRIDVNDAGDIRVIDYKTGDTPRTPQDMHIRNGAWTDLQLPLYRHMARAMVDRRPFATMSEDAGDRTIELAYFNLCADPGKVEICIADWDRDQLCEADNVTREILDQIVRGEFVDVRDGVDEEGAIGALAAWATSLPSANNRGANQ